MRSFKIKPNCIISDWDETITVKDTIKYVSQVPYKLNPNLTPKFEYFTNVYMKNYNEYKEKFGLRNSLNDEIRFQKGMRPIEMSSIKELERYMIFKGLTKEYFEAQAHLIELRSGFVDFVNKCRQIGIEFIILSVNWSSLIIKKALELNGIFDIKIITNELEFKNGLTTGTWIGNEIRTSEDKLDFVKKYGENFMYIGDSLTDLLPLLHSKYSFIIQDGKICELDEKYNLNFIKGNWNDFMNYIE
ncbi:unnamed protein product [Candida verbasci]|uniref:Haloacid dehalogenase-like hydrolase n=1 Tax=Candida verbasci TaxID=1227364 RepID=A0A9W4XDH9_9ASCO|nr:unnamed protein product [Candida verbasci]